MAESAAGRIMLLSVKPRFAKAILDGAKHVELRRVLPSEEIRQVVLYSTSPEQAVVGWFDVERIEVGSPGSLWQRFGAVSSLSKEEFDAYFTGCVQGVAIVVGDTSELEPPLPLQVLGAVRPPQSFSYLPDEVLELLENQSIRSA